MFPKYNIEFSWGLVAMVTLRRTVVLRRGNDAESEASAWVNSVYPSHRHFTLFNMDSLPQWDQGNTHYSSKNFLSSVTADLWPLIQGINSPTTTIFWILFSFSCNPEFTIKQPNKQQNVSLEHEKWDVLKHLLQHTFVVSWVSWHGGNQVVWWVGQVGAGGAQPPLLHPRPSSLALVFLPSHGLFRFWPQEEDQQKILHSRSQFFCFCF